MSKKEVIMEGIKKINSEPKAKAEPKTNEAVNAGLSIVIGKDGKPTIAQNLDAINASTFTKEVVAGAEYAKFAGHDAALMQKPQGAQSSFARVRK